MFYTPRIYNVPTRTCIIIIIIIQSIFYYSFTTCVRNALGGGPILRTVDRLLWCVRATTIVHSVHQYVYNPFVCVQGYFLIFRFLFYSSSPIRFFVRAARKSVRHVARGPGNTRPRVLTASSNNTRTLHAVTIIGNTPECILLLLSVV